MKEGRVSEEPRTRAPSAAERAHARFLRERDDARTALKQSLEEIISGASYADTDCLIDQLEDRGFRVVRK